MTNRAKYLCVGDFVVNKFLEQLEMWLWLLLFFLYITLLGILGRWLFIVGRAIPYGFCLLPAVALLYLPVGLPPVILVWLFYWLTGLSHSDDWLGDRIFWIAYFWPVVPVWCAFPPDD